MNRTLTLLSISLIFALSTLPVQAQPLQPTDLASAQPVQKAGLPAITVFVPKTGNRKEDSAKAVTAMHNKMGKQGWTVIGVDTYIENGDQWGFFITYVKQKQDWAATD